MERRPIQKAAGSLAASAFVAVTQILTRDIPDTALLLATIVFAVGIPFQIIFFFTPIPRAPHQGFSSPQRWYWVIYISSTCLILFGFVAVFWHFAWWIGILFACAAYVAFRVYKYFANNSKEFDEQDKQDN
jgi:hypothetical protein